MLENIQPQMTPSSGCQILIFPCYNVLIRYGATVGDLRRVREHKKVDTAAEVIFREPFLVSDTQPPGRRCPWILSSLQRSTSNQLCDANNTTVWGLHWFRGDWVLGNQLITTKCFCFSQVRQPRCGCFCHWGEALTAGYYFESQLKSGNWLQMPKWLCKSCHYADRLKWLTVGSGALYQGCFALK